MRVSIVPRLLFSLTLIFVILTVVTAAPPLAHNSLGEGHQQQHERYEQQRQLEVPASSLSDPTSTSGISPVRVGQKQHAHRGWRTLLRETWDVVTSRSGLRLDPGEYHHHVARPRGRYMRRGRAHP